MQEGEDRDSAERGTGQRQRDPVEGAEPAAPSFGTDGGVEYMFYEAGQRSRSTIAVARAV
ncbi:hypothetical protein ABT061_35395 [Streptosporangium sp. NPDC002544]|uniref:hypothetical protein n=1 Tax=Streptosporangium sp. NPDC002544 TaxID=3154538 RepID=UPI00331A9348